MSPAMRSANDIDDDIHLFNRLKGKHKAVSSGLVWVPFFSHKTTKITIFSVLSEKIVNIVV